ncbi:MAG: chloride channel protein [Clostridia bacterium]|nr:chloride channel protein [Clostridia bacterium]
MKEEKHYHLLRLVKNLKYRLVWQGILIGIAAGLVVSLYRFLLSYAESFAIHLYTVVRSNLWAVGLLFVGLALVGILVGFLTKWQPMIKGSGIPQVEGQILGFFQISWWKVIIGKIIGGFLALAAGLSLGREGPSIQLGAATGEGISQTLRRDETEKRYLLTCGASAGLAAAFNAPLAGMMFALEEVHKNFSVSVLLSTMASAVTADMVSKFFFGMDSVFGGHSMVRLPLEYYLILPVLGILLGACGWLYNKVLLLSQRAYRKIPFLKGHYVMIVPFLAAGVAGLFLPEILGGGHKIITSLLDFRFAISYVALLLVCKFVFSMVSFGSGAPGGIFFPLLVLGALVGALFGQIAITYFGLNSCYYVNFLLLGMVGMFTGIVRAPVTGIILIVEMSGSFTQMLDLAVVAVCAYLMADLLGSKPVYESLLENMRPHEENKPELLSDKEKVLINFVVETGCRAEWKAIRELSWPKGCLVVSIVRGGEEMIPNGESILQTGDYVIVMCPKEREVKYREKLSPRFNKHR